MKSKVLYYPPDSGVNEYSLRVQGILSEKRVIESFKIKNIKSYLFKRNDAVIINWIENEILGKDGKISVKGLIKVTVKLILFKISSKKIVYVRHNVYPHITKNTSVPAVKKIIKLFYALSDHVVIHSPILIDGFEKYIPHPLYSFPLVKDSLIQSGKKEGKYVIFGRIVRYKKIEEVIRSFPKEKELIIAGSCQDLEYLAELQVIAKEFTNIKIDARFFSEDEAKKLLSTSSAVIISHSDEDMIVSGSFFYALSQGVSILCVETPFMKWAENNLGSKVIKSFSSINELCEHLRISSCPYYYDQTVISKVNEMFSDNIILRLFDEVL